MAVVCVGAILTASPGDAQSDEDLNALIAAAVSLSLEERLRLRAGDTSSDLLELADKVEQRARDAVKKAKEAEPGTPAESDAKKEARRLSDLAQELRSHARSDADAGTTKLVKLLEALRTARSTERQLSGKVGAGFNADESLGFGTNVPPQVDLYKVSTSAKLSRGGYPSVFTLAADISVLLKGGEFQEEVTKFAVSYDYSTNDTIRVAAFAERFSDNYLSISQRWEVGVEAGVRWEAGRPKSAKSQGEIKALCKDPLKTSGRYWRTCLTKDQTPITKETTGRLFEKRSIPGIGPSPKADSEQLMIDVEESRQAAIRSIRRKNAHLQFGVAVGVLGELERASIPAKETVTDANNVSVENSVTLQVRGDHRFRLRLHPHLTFRPTEHFAVAGDLKFKLPFPPGDDGPVFDKAVTTTRKDWRYDLEVSANYSLAKDETSGQEKVGLALTWNRLVDNRPPSFEAAGRVLSTTVAAERHDTLKLEIGLEW